MAETPSPKLELQHNYAAPLVTVTIPSYNAAETLAETLDSVLAQTYPNIEVIVVDDGSTDNTQEIIKKYATRITCIHQANSGLASARNVGCRAARGEYIALMDADDLCMPERIELQVAYMEQNPEIVMCSSDFVGFDNNGLIANFHIGSYYMRILAEKNGIEGFFSHFEQIYVNGIVVPTYFGDIYEEMAMGSFIHPPTVFFRKSILDECGYVDEHIVNLCDSDWFVRMSRVGKIGFIARPLIKYRISQDQMSGSRNRLQIALDMILVMEGIISRDPDLYYRNRKQFCMLLGKKYLDYADALLDVHRFPAIINLIKSVKFGVIKKQSFKVLIKVLTPKQILSYWRDHLK